MNNDDWLEDYQIKLAESRALYEKLLPDEKLAADKRSANMAAKMQSSVPTWCLPVDHPERTERPKSVQELAIKIEL